MISKVIVAVVIRPFPKQFQAHHCALKDYSQVENIRDSSLFQQIHPEVTLCSV